MIKIPNNIKGLIFDCDGTLVDSMPSHWAAWHDTFKSFGLKCPHDFLTTMAGAPIREILNEYIKKTGAEINIEEFIKEKHKRSLENLREVRAIPEVVEVAQYYHEKLPMSVASGGSKVNVDLSIKAIGLTDYFTTVITADDPFPGKPSPHIFLEAAKRMNVKPEDCLVFEDGFYGIIAAKEAGMQYIDVRRLILDT